MTFYDTFNKIWTVSQIIPSNETSCPKKSLNTTSSKDDMLADMGKRGQTSSVLVSRKNLNIIFQILHVTCPFKTYKFSLKFFKVL